MLKIPKKKIHRIDDTNSAQPLTGFWGLKDWNLRDCPLAAVDNPNNKFITVHFTCHSSALNAELRHACKQKLESKKWSAHATGTFSQITRIITYLNQTFPHVNSLLERSLDHWMLSLRTYLVEKGEYFETDGIWLDASQRKRKRLKGNRCLEVFRSIYKEIADAQDTRPMWQREVWDLRRLGVSLNPSKSEHTLSFRGLKSPAWLLEAAQKYLYMMVTTRSASSCAANLNSLKKFGAFLLARHIHIEASEISRVTILEYMNYLVEIGASSSARSEALRDLNLFFERCIREEWLLLPDKRLIYSDDSPSVERRKPRFIPESVMEQLAEHSNSLPPQARRMLSVLTECGMRVSELCTLKLDCLSQDAVGGWFLHYFMLKLKKDHTIPVSQETAAVIREQRKERMDASNRVSDYLFVGVKGHAAKQDTFSKIINDLGEKHNIRGEDGRLWRFQPHQFRHTVGTRMINNGVRQHFVQKYLGHESPEMTSVYAHIHDKTMKDEFENFLERRGRLVDVTGQAVERSDALADAGDLQWFKKNVSAQTLPNGYCALPLVQSACPHANACLTCGHFRTDANFLSQHREQLLSSERLVQISRASGWTRQTEMNERVTQNLQNIINALETETTENE